MADFRRTAADVDVSRNQALLAALLHRAGAVAPPLSSRASSCGGAHETSRFIRKQLGDFLRIIAPRRFTRDDHPPVSISSRLRPTVWNVSSDQHFERLGFDVPITAEGREQDRERAITLRSSPIGFRFNTDG